MTLAGYILMTVVSHGAIFDTPTMAATQVLLPPTVDCKSAAADILNRKIASEAYCIPVYDK